MSGGAKTNGDVNQQDRPMPDKEKPPSLAVFHFDRDVEHTDMQLVGQHAT